MKNDFAIGMGGGGNVQGGEQLLVVVDFTVAYQMNTVHMKRLVGRIIQPVDG
jgi:hypothetical protein